MSNSTLNCIRLAVIACAGPAAAQITGPLAGYIAHPPTNSIRAITGLPGGAIVGAPLVRDIRFGAVSPDGRWALVQRESAAMVKLDAAEAPEAPVAGLEAAIDAAAWSGSGQALAAYSSTSKSVQRVRWSAGQWVADPPVDLSGLPGRLTSLSADWEGDRIAAGLADVESGGLYIVSGGAASLLMRAPLPVIAAFARSGTLFAAGSARGRVEVFEGDARAGSLAVGESAAAAEISGLAPSPDGRCLLIAFKDLAVLSVFDLASGQALPEHPLDAAPTAFSPMAGGSWIVLNAPRQPDEPIHLVHGREPPAVYFVPIGEP